MIFTVREHNKIAPAGRRISSVARYTNYQLATLRGVGDGWVLVGDAWGFIDPVYSSGVYLAVKSGELAADCITDGLGKGPPKA